MLHVQWPPFYSGREDLSVMVLQNIYDFYTNDEVLGHANYMKRKCNIYHQGKITINKIVVSASRFRRVVEERGAREGLGG